MNEYTLEVPHGLEIRIMPLPLLEEADYIKVRRGAALILLGKRWLLHSANAVQRRAHVLDIGLLHERARIGRQ